MHKLESEIMYVCVYVCVMLLVTSFTKFLVSGWIKHYVEENRKFPSTRKTYEKVKNLIL